MRLIAALTDEISIRHYPTGVGLPAVPPPIAPARPPPQTGVRVHRLSLHPKVYAGSSRRAPPALPPTGSCAQKSGHAPYWCHSSSRTSQLCPDSPSGTGNIWKKLLKALTAAAENSFLPAIHAQEMAFVEPIRRAFVVPIRTLVPGVPIRFYCWLLMAKGCG